MFTQLDNQSKGAVVAIGLRKKKDNKTIAQLFHENEFIDKPIMSFSQASSNNIIVQLGGNAEGCGEFTVHSVASRLDWMIEVESLNVLRYQLNGSLKVSSKRLMW